jgi:hypothetical protein
MHFVRKLAVVLDHVDIIRSRDDTGEARSVGVPKRGRNNGYLAQSVSGCVTRATGSKFAASSLDLEGERTILDHYIETFLDQEVIVEDNQAKG